MKALPSLQVAGTPRHTQTPRARLPRRCGPRRGTCNYPWRRECDVKGRGHHLRGQPPPILWKALG